MPEPETPVIDAPVGPVAASAKSPESTPVTLFENVTVHETEAAFVGEAPARLIELTAGGAVSTVNWRGVLNAPGVRPSVACTRQK